MSKSGLEKQEITVFNSHPLPHHNERLYLMDSLKMSNDRRTSSLMGRKAQKDLPTAPPIDARKPTAAELGVQEENNQRVMTLLK